MGFQVVCRILRIPVTFVNKTCFYGGLSQKFCLFCEIYPQIPQLQTLRRIDTELFKDNIESAVNKRGLFYYQFPPNHIFFCHHCLFAWLFIYKLSHPSSLHPSSLSHSTVLLCAARPQYKPWLDVRACAAVQYNGSASKPESLIAGCCVAAVSSASHFLSRCSPKARARVPPSPLDPYLSTWMSHSLSSPRIAVCWRSEQEEGDGKASCWDC